MRKLSFFLLVATVAAPALAQADQGRAGRHHRNDSSEQSESRQQKPAESRRSEANSGSGGDRAARIEAKQAGSFDRVREHFQLQRAERQQHQEAVSTGSGNNDRVERSAGSEPSRSASSLRPRERQIRTIPDTRTGVTTHRPGSVARAFEGRHRRDYRDGHYKRWSNNWRHDHRYDWDNYRNHHRSIFRLGSYYDPFGWSYRRWSIGSLLYPGYYGSRYWLNDPWHYRLPPAYGPYRWVRYWNDALLVNTYTGEVVDVIHSFFW